jgi:hypothetical protein
VTELIGRQLKADELRAKLAQLVVIAPPDHEGVYMTMWVEEVRDNLVVFAAYGLSDGASWHVINLVSNDGKLVDDRGREVKVYDYLGDP